MSYNIKKFEERFIENQVEIGNKVFEKWTGQMQTSVERLKAAYSTKNPNFDPDTKLYAFKDEEMIGFTTASILPQEEGKTKIARYEFPLVLDGFDGAQDQLYETAIDTLREKGVKVVLSRASPLWGNTIEYAASKGYSMDHVMSRKAEFSIKDIDLDKLSDFKDIESFDRVKDMDEMMNTFVKFYKLEDQDQINGLREQILNLPKSINIIAENIIKDGKSIIGRQLIYNTPNDDTVIFGTMMTLDDNEEIKSKLLSSGIRKVKESGFERCKINVYGNFEENERLYSLLNLNFEDELIMYRLDI